MTWLLDGPLRTRGNIVWAVLLACPALALGQPTTALNAPKKGALPNLVSVTAPQARVAALSDTHRLVVFGHDSRTRPDAHLSLVRLDEKGTPTAYATTWKMPCPPALAKLGTYPLALTFHPKLPLLYVWQDTAVPFGNPVPPTPPELTQFDHLLIYNVAGEKPELAAALCRGKDDFLHGQEGAALALDPTAGFLFVSNLRDPKNVGHFRLGRFPLDADGLPDVLDDKDRKLPRDQRLKKLNEKNAAGPLLPPAITPFEYGYILSFGTSGSAQGMHVVSKDAVLAGTTRGIAMWRPEDRDCALNAVPLKGPGYTLLGSHPERPFLYAVTSNANLISRIRHADGYPTLLPEQWSIPDAKLFTAPAILKGGKLAVGGLHHVYLLSLDKEGRPLPDVTRIQVFNPLVRALVYSPRFDRLYVSVDASK